MIGAYGPVATLLEVAALQEKWPAAEGPMALGAQMSSSGSCRRDKYCHNGGIAFGHQSTAPPAQTS
jgi:hypothetical protein